MLKTETHHRLQHRSSNSQKPSKGDLGSKPSGKNTDLSVEQVLNERISND